MVTRMKEQNMDEALGMNSQNTMTNFHYGRKSYKIDEATPK